jgi:nucleoside-diphosphate-sugar epimerase
MRVLLIGGNGFIGPAVIQRLRQAGAEVSLFHRGNQQGIDPEVTHIFGDRNDLGAHAEAFRKLAPDVVIDFILSSGRQASGLMETFRGIAGRVVALSSIDVYRACGILHGSEPGPLQPTPLTEDSELRTVSRTYPPEVVKKARTKLAWLDEEYDKIQVERAVMAEPELPGTVLRLPFVYGPGDKMHRLFPMVKRMDDGRKVILLAAEWADWSPSRGYVENVAAAIVAAATSERAQGRIYNVAETAPGSELEWTRAIARAAGWTGEIRLTPLERMPLPLRKHGNPQQHWFADSTRIREELSYREPVALDSALTATIAWERANPPAEIDPAQFDYAAEDACIG